MKFERGKDPKKAMGIGIGSQSIWLRGIYERKERTSWDHGEVDYEIINGPDGHRIFEDIQKNGCLERHIPYHVHTGSSGGYIPIGWLKGKWVEYLKTYYYIPENEYIKRRKI